MDYSKFSIKSLNFELSKAPIINELLVPPISPPMNPPTKAPKIGIGINISPTKAPHIAPPTDVPVLITIFPAF